MRRTELMAQLCAAAMLVMAGAMTAVAYAAPDADQAPAKPVAPRDMKLGDVLSGQLNAMRSRDAKGKRVDIYQVVTEPRRLPAPAGLCNLETGPETFEIVVDGEAQAAQLKRLIGKDVAFKVAAVACAEQAGQMSEALVTKWSLVGKN